MGEPARARRTVLHWRRLRVIPVVGLLAVTALVTGAGSSAPQDGRPAGGAPASEPMVVQAAPGDPRGAPGTPTPSPAPDLQPGIRAANDEAANAGATLAVAILDRVTRQEWTNVAVASQPLFGASLAKLFLADNLLYRQSAGEFTLSAAERGLLEAMLTVSDDSAALTLYGRYGGESMITEVAARYGLPSLQPTFNQYFGIPRALPGEVWASSRAGWGAFGIPSSCTPPACWARTTGTPWPSSSSTRAATSRSRCSTGSPPWSCLRPC